jgi:hypothetical protein
MPVLQKDFRPQFVCSLDQHSALPDFFGFVSARC